MTAEHEEDEVSNLPYCPVADDEVSKLPPEYYCPVRSLTLLSDIQNRLPMD